jgi:hypothetical protein
MEMTTNLHRAKLSDLVYKPGGGTDAEVKNEK